MRKKTICALGFGLMMGLAVPSTAAFAETPKGLPSFEAPGETAEDAEAGPGGSSQSADEGTVPSSGAVSAAESAGPETSPTAGSEETVSGEADKSQADSQPESGQSSDSQPGVGETGESQTEAGQNGGSQREPAVNAGASSAIGPGANLPPSSGGTVSKGTNKEIGPGGASQTSSLPEFTTMTVQNPVVQAAEKYSYDQMVSDITALQRRYGTSHMTVNTIGTSADGRAIYDVIIGNPNAPNHVLIQGAMHAREYMNPLLIMKQIEDALAFYNTGSYHGRSLSDLLNQVAVHFVPMSNPDGVTLCQFGIDAIRSPELKQKIQTCYASDTAAGRTSQDLNGYLSVWKANARGVDLNQNFDGRWAYASSTWLLPSYSGYKGLVPVSEPESQALVNLINSGRNWKGVINYHSMGQVIYWDIEDNKVKAQSQHLGQLISAATGGYQMLYSGGGGGFKDWLQLAENPVPSITVETGTVACPLPLSEWDQLWSENRTGWAVLADFALLY